MKKRIGGAIMSGAALWSGQSLAQTGAPMSDTDLSKESVNPVTRHITLPLRYEADFFDRASAGLSLPAAPSAIGHPSRARKR